MNDRTIRFLGGSPGAVLLRLVILSLIVGVILSALGISPLDIISRFEEMLYRIYNMGFGAVRWLVDYFLIGAVIVFPVWLVLRLLKFGRG